MLVPSLGINLGTPNHLPGTRNAAGVQLMVSTGRAHKGHSQPSACSSFSFVHNFRCLPGQELSTNLGSQNFCVFFFEEVWNMIEIKVMWSISVKNWNRHHLHLSFKQTFFFTRIFSTFFSWRQKTAPEKNSVFTEIFFFIKSWKTMTRRKKSPKPNFEFWRRCQTLQKLGCLSQTWERLYPAQRLDHRLASRPITSLNTSKYLAAFSFSFFPTLLNNDLSADFHRKLSENMYLNANKILYNDTSRLG